MHVSVLYAVFAPHPETSRSTSYTALLMENLCFRSSSACSDSKAYNFTKKQTKKTSSFSRTRILILYVKMEKICIYFLFFSFAHRLRPPISYQSPQVSSYSQFRSQLYGDHKTSSV